MPESHNWGDVLKNIAAANIGVRFGPGVLPVIGTIWVIGFAASAVEIWALQAQAGFALAAVCITVAAMIYISERLTHFARHNPITALMGGSQLLKLIENQTGAKDPSIVIRDSNVLIGGVQGKLDSDIEKPGRDDL